MSASFATLPKPPYYAVIFSSQRGDQGDEAYAAAAQRMVVQTHTPVAGQMVVAGARGA